MKAFELRQSILQAAVQGKLVPQDLHDQPASKLLEHIRTEKLKLVKEGKIKKEKPLPPITEAEIPYDLPEKWVWCRLGDISIQITSGSRDWARYYSTNGAIFLRMGNLSQNSFQLRLNSIQHVTPPQNAEGNRTKLEANDILISITGEVGNLGRIPEDFGEAYINQHTALVRFPAELQNLYFPNALLSPLCKSQFNEPQRGIKNSFRLTDLSYMLIPVPPRNEQKRIVAKLNELIALCDELEAAENELEALEEHFIEHLPKSILQMAVQGKLVPQDLHDEPALELLDCIRAERAKLIKESKLEKEKSLPPITESEIPYDLPEGWVWCRLGELVQVISGTSYQKNNVQFKGVRILRGGNIHNNQIFLLEDDVFLPDEFFDPEKTIQNNDIVIVASTGSSTVIGKPGFACKEVIGSQIGAFLRVVRPVNDDIFYYLKIIFSSEFYREHIRIMAQGTNINNVKNEYITEFLIPVPPLDEQQRIVAKVDELMALCNELKIAKSMPVKRIENNVVPFPQKAAQEDEIGIAARGDATQPYSPKLQGAISKLFEGDSHG